MSTRRLAESRPGAPALLVPAYFGPWESAAWDRLLAARPAVVVINPASGPGEHEHAGYRDLVARLRAVGSVVLGYITTSYLAKPLEQCAAEAARHRRFYGVDGVFWDEVPAERALGRVRALRALRSYAADDAGTEGTSGTTTRTGPRCVFNPGRPVTRAWFRSLPDSVFVTFEGPASGYGLVDPPGPPERQCHLVHSATVGDEVELLPGVGYAYVTADLPPNPWDVFAGPAPAQRRP